MTNSFLLPHTVVCRMWAVESRFHQRMYSKKLLGIILIPDIVRRSAFSPLESSFMQREIVDLNILPGCRALIQISCKGLISQDSHPVEHLYSPLPHLSTRI